MSIRSALLHLRLAAAVTTAALSLASPALHAQGASALRVEMLPVAQVQQPRVALGEIAYLSSPDLQLLRRAVALPVGTAPRVGDSTVLDQERLSGWVSTRLGVPAESVRWGGVASTVVKSAARELDGESLVAMAQPVLLEHLYRAVTAKGIADAQVELIPVSLPLGISVPLRDAEFRVRSLAGVAPAKRMLVWMDIFAEQRHVKAVPVRFEVSVFASSVVASQPVRLGDGIDIHNTQRQVVDIVGLLARNGGEMFASLESNPSASRALHARSPLKAGDAITVEKVQRATAVSRGDRVTLVASSGLVSLESKVEVLQAGEVGQIVRVRPTNGTADLMAKVIGPGQLELQP